MKTEKCFCKIYYCGNNVKRFSAAKYDDIEKAQNIIKNIDAFDDNNCITKIEIEGQIKGLFCFIDTHTKKNRYHFEIFKCGKIECTVCKPIRMPKSIWDKISKRSRFLPLLEPINIESWKKQRFNEI